MLERVVVRLTSRPWLGVALGAYWALCVAALGVHYAQLPARAEVGASVRTGDFVAFYAAALAVRRGGGQRLYERAQQERLQAEVGATEVRPFLYPASFAAALSPLGGLPYRPAFLVANAALLLAGLGAALLLAPALPRLRAAGPLLTFAAAAGFAPVLRTWLAGGQTTPLTLLLLAGATLGVVQGRPRLCGVFVGLLGYKPQFLPPLLLALLLWRAWGALGAAAAVGLAHWALGALVGGAAWPLAMLRGLAWYQPAEAAANASSHLSLLAACQGLLPGASGRAAALLLVAATLALLARLSAASARDDPRARRLAWAFALAACLLVSPHTQHYDVGLLVVPVLLLLEQDLQDGRAPGWPLRAALVVGFVGYPLHGTGEALGVQPLVAWPVVVCAWAASRWRAGGREELDKASSEDHGAGERGG